MPTLGAILSTVSLFAFGACIILAVFKQPAVISWEDRTLTKLADMAKARREQLEQRVNTKAGEDARL